MLKLKNKKNVLKQCNDMYMVYAIDQENIFLKI